MNVLKVLFVSVFTLLLPESAFSQAKSVEVMYTRAYKNFRDTSDVAPRLLEEHKYLLSCSPAASRFEKISPVITDDGNVRRYEVKVFYGNLQRDSDYAIHYRNTEKKTKLYQAKFMDSIFLVKEDYNQYKWEIKNEKKEILGFECYKAVGSYQEYSHIFKRLVTESTTVWYAPGIPLPFGPSGYDGLPGLVLEAYKASFYFIATEITFCPEEAIVSPPDKGKSVNRKEFNEAISRMYKNYTNRKN